MGAGSSKVIPKTIYGADEGRRVLDTESKEAGAARQALSSTATAAERVAVLKRIWNRIDADGSGALDEGEVQQVLLEMGHDKEKLDIVAVMADLDGDRNGEVEYHEFETWFLQQNVANQLEIATKKSPEPTDVFKPHVVTRSGPTLIGKSAAAALRSRRSAVDLCVDSAMGLPATETLWDACWSRESTEVWFPEGEPGVLGLKVADANRAGRDYVIIEYIKPNSQADHRKELRIGQLLAAVNILSTERKQSSEVQALLTSARPLRLLVRNTVEQTDPAANGQRHQTHEQPSGKARQTLLRSVCCGRRGAARENRADSQAFQDVQNVATSSAIVNDNDSSVSSDEVVTGLSPGTQVPHVVAEYWRQVYSEKAIWKQKMPLRQQVQPALMLPNSDPDHWRLVQDTLGGMRPKTLSELRQRLNVYAGGALGFQGRNKISVAGLSELLRRHPELNGTFLETIIPHLISKIDALTDFCRKTLEFGTGWKLGMWQGGPMWFNSSTHTFQRQQPLEIRRIRSWLPREWVQNCCNDYLKMLRQGERKTVEIPREMCCTLLANMFMCVFRTSDPVRNNLPRRSFEQLFASREPHDVARVRMMVCYFERSIERDAQPPPVDIEQLYADLVEFDLVSPDGVDKMRRAILDRMATPAQYTNMFQDKIERLKAERALRQAEESGKSQSWEKPSAALTMLANGTVRISRLQSYMTPQQWAASESALLGLQIVPPGDEHTGLLSRGCLQVHSSSVILGGSSLTGNQTHRYLPCDEEVRWFERPELLIANLLVPPLLDNEAVHIIGAERFSQAAGLGCDLRFEKAVLDDTHRLREAGPRDGMLLHAITCIDPIDLCGSCEPWTFEQQMDASSLLREINKLHAGFLPVDEFELCHFPTIASGSNCWGCGRHLCGWGHYELRAVLQWLAASQTGRKLRYFIEDAPQELHLHARLQKFMTRMTRPRLAVNFEAAFRSFDEDGDGDISSTEFKRGLEKLGVVLKPQQLQDVLRVFDKDGGGSIDYREFARQFNGGGGGMSNLSRQITMELRSKFEKVSDPEHEKEAKANAREARESGGEEYICVERCRIRAGPEIDSEEVGMLERGKEIVVLQKVEISAMKAMEGNRVDDDYRGQMVTRLRIGGGTPGWVSLTMPGGKPTMEPCAQTKIISVGTVWTALATLGRWMLKPRNRSHSSNPLNGADFLEVLARAVEDPEGFQDEAVDLRLCVIKAEQLQRADGLLGKSDPYAIVYLNETKVGTTQVVYDNLAPVWKEQFPLRVNVEINNTLRVEVWDWDKVGDHEFLGMVELEGTAATALPYYETAYELGPRFTSEHMSWKDRLFKHDFHVGGCITLSVVSTARDNDETKKWGISRLGLLVPLPKDCGEQAVGEEQEHYELAVHTGTERGAGTDANVFCKLVGHKAGRRTGEIQLDDSVRANSRHKNLFERGHCDEFIIASKPLGELLKIRIGHDDSGIDASWFLDKVTVRPQSSGKLYVFQCGKWFDRKKGDGKIIRELLSTE